MLHNFRHIYEQSTLPLGRLSLRLGLRPDFWTFFSLFLGVIAGYVLAQGWWWAGVVMILLVQLADTLDGATARAGGTASRFGGILDHVFDRYSEFLFIGGILLSGHVAAWLGLWAISGMVLASYARAAAESIGGLPNVAVGFAGRAEKLILLEIGLGIEALGVVGTGAIGWALLLIGLLSHVTVVQRLLFARRAIQARGGQAAAPAPAESGPSAAPAAGEPRSPAA